LPQTFKTLTKITAWILGIFGVISVFVPTILGITSGALMGTIKMSMPVNFGSTGMD